MPLCRILNLKKFIDSIPAPPIKENFKQKVGRPFLSRLSTTTPSIALHI
jgi:hypothetical protein